MVSAAGPIGVPQKFAGGPGQVAKRDAVVPAPVSEQEQARGRQEHNALSLVDQFKKAGTAPRGDPSC
jgi:hypothetical protein